MLLKQKCFKGSLWHSEKPLTSAKWCSENLTFKSNEDFFSGWLKKQTATAEPETAATCWTRAGRNFRTRPETGFGSFATSPVNAPLCSAGHCREGQRPVFVSSLLLAPSTPSRHTPSLSPCLPESPLSPPFRLWSCFPLIKISLHTERT